MNGKKRKLDMTCNTQVPPKKRLTTYQPQYGPFQNEDMVLHFMQFLTDFEDFTAFVLTCKTMRYCWEHGKGKGCLAYRIDQPIYTTIYFVPGLVSATYFGEVTQTHFGMPVEVAHLRMMTNPWKYERYLPPEMVERFAEHINAISTIEVEYAGVCPRKIVFPYGSVFYLDGTRAFIYYQEKYQLKIEYFHEKKEWSFEQYKQNDVGEWVKDGYVDRYIQAGRLVHIVSRIPYMNGKRYGWGWECKRYKTSRLSFERLQQFFGETLGIELIYKNKTKDLTVKHIKDVSIGENKFIRDKK